jgi:hypothetical protein
MEIVEYSDAEETAVCSLASIALPKFVKDGAFDFERLYEIAYLVTINLNKVPKSLFFRILQKSLIRSSILTIIRFPKLVDRTCVIAQSGSGYKAWRMRSFCCGCRSIQRKRVP